MCDQGFKDHQQEAPANHLTIEEEEILLAIGRAQGVPREKLISFIKKVKEYDKRFNGF